MPPLAALCLVCWFIIMYLALAYEPLLFTNFVSLLAPHQCAHLSSGTRTSPCHTSGRGGEQSYHYYHSLSF